MARFFTWIEKHYSEPSEVPERVRTFLRTMWLVGSTVQELASAFDMPEEWVEDFVREEIPEAKPH